MLISIQVDSTRRLDATRCQVATPRTQDDIEIIQLSSKCTKVAEDLLAELRKLGLERSGSLRHALSKSVRVIRRKALLKEKQDLLDKYRRVLDTRILIRLDARTLKDTQDIQCLERGVQALALGLEQGHNTVAQLLVNHSQQIQDHLDTKFDRHAKATEGGLVYEQFLESLFFPEIVSRNQQIPEAFKGTCSWIFASSDDQESKTRPWSNFRKWLETENGVYWISGKPGSGKSTLMKYIVNDDRTPQLLADWEKGTDLIVVSFYFYNAGIPLQKSFTGLLRSLLYQIASQWPDLVNLVASPTKSSKDVFEASKGWKPLTAWTDQSLLSLLNRFLDEKPANISLCAFVDGLDEFIGDEEYLLHMIELFDKSLRCKICVSSRPEQAFRHEFRLCPQLRVQDLNREDIERTAAGKLRPSMERHSNLKSEDDITSLVVELARKASGVFLWLDLMTRDLIRGSKNGDTIEELQTRLATTPDAINGLYEYMLQKLDRLYLEDCVHYCRIFISAIELGFETPMMLLTLALAEPESWNHLVDFDLAYFTESRFNSVCQILETRLTSRCGGLLEVESHRHKEVDPEATIPYFDRKVDFVHRTAMEYVQKAYGISYLGSSALMESKALMARGIIGTLIISETEYDLSADRDESLRDSMLAISTMSSSAAPRDDDKPAKSLQIDLMNQVCQLLQNLYSFRNPIPAEKKFFDDQNFLEEFIVSESCGLGYLLNSRLSIAAFFGCHHYVRSCLSTETFSADRMSEFLQAALAGFEILIHAHVSSYLSRVSTVQTILLYGADIDLNEYFTATESGWKLDMFGTLWGRLFHQLMSRSYACFGDSAFTTLQQEYTNTQQQLTRCSLELTQKLLSLGANPNTRLVSHRPFHGTRGDGLFYVYYMDVSPLTLLEIFPIGNAEIEACLRSAGAAYYKRVRFIYYQGPCYPVTDIQSQRLAQLLMDHKVGSGFSDWSPSNECGDALREVLASIAENDAISYGDMLDSIYQLDVSF
ncbi:MAG: hypothetical protein LQ346_002712 [Caloplaca aetnensis]|nr:MAG: hypothetical protein LQ346_002712 [Caloplaca aetnensis]